MVVATALSAILVAALDTQIVEIPSHSWKFRKKNESSSDTRLTDQFFAVVNKQRPRNILGVHI
jgi:hypothetical protein